MWHPPLSLGLLLLAGCAADLADATVRIHNGATAPSERARRSAAAPTTGDGTYRLSPSTVTWSVTGISLLPEGFDQPYADLEPIEDCTATYDRSLGSLAALADCDVSVPVGTWGGVAIQLENRFSVVIDDAAAGIWSDPSAASGLSATRPVGGPGAIDVRDQNDSRDTMITSLFLDEPFVVDADTPLAVSVLFEPTNWMVTDRQGDTFTPPRMAGNPPLTPTVSGFGAAAFYSNVDSPMSYNASGGGPVGSDHPVVGYLLLYTDAGTPSTVTWQEHDLCGSGTRVVSYAGDGVVMGTYGYLGVDGDGVLAWAAPDRVLEGVDGPPRISGYKGVFRMPEVAEVGGATVLEYRCTPDVPAPTSGSTYASGAPEFIPEGQVELELLAR